MSEKSKKSQLSGDNRCMTGNVNIYICSEAMDKDEKNLLEIDRITKETKPTESRNVNDEKDSKDKIISSIDYTDYPSKNNVNSPKATSSSKNRDFSKMVSCRCRLFDESDVWLRNTLKKQSENAKDYVEKSSGNVVDDGNRIEVGNGLEGKLGSEKSTEVKEKVDEKNEDEPKKSNDNEVKNAKSLPRENKKPRESTKITENEKKSNEKLKNREESNIKVKNDDKPVQPKIKKERHAKRSCDNVEKSIRKKRNANETKTVINKEDKHKKEKDKVEIKRSTKKESVEIQTEPFVRKVKKSREKAIKNPTTREKNISTNENVNNSKDQSSFFFKIINLMKGKKLESHKEVKPQNKHRNTCSSRCRGITNDRPKRKKSGTKGSKYHEKPTNCICKSITQVSRRETKKCQSKIARDKKIKDTTIKNREPEVHNKLLKEQNGVKTSPSQFCFSCLYPIKNCVCKDKTESAKVATNRTNGKDKLSYQQSIAFPSIVKELQYKMRESTHCIFCQCDQDRCLCYKIIDDRKNSVTKEDLLCTCNQLKSNGTFEHIITKKPRAKCYYCKNSPCACLVLGAR